MKNFIASVGYFPEVLQYFSVIYDGLFQIMPIIPLCGWQLQLVTVKR
jgi:hypothetical protein